MNIIIVERDDTGPNSTRRLVIRGNSHEVCSLRSRSGALSFLLLDFRTDVPILDHEAYLDFQHTQQGLLARGISFDRVSR